MKTDGERLGETRAMLAEATDPSVIVRLRAREEVLERRMNEAGLIGRVGGKIEGFGRGLRKWDEARHPRARAGKFAFEGGPKLSPAAQALKDRDASRKNAPPEVKALARKFQGFSPKTLTPQEQEIMRKHGKDAAGLVLHHGSTSEFTGGPGSEMTLDRPLSTSEGDRGRSPASLFGNVHYELHVDSGSTFRPNDFVDAYEGEREHDLPIGAKIKVVSRTKDPKGGTHIVARVSSGGSSAAEPYHQRSHRGMMS